jgi:hypothetical protein
MQGSMTNANCKEPGIPAAFDEGQEVPMSAAFSDAEAALSAPFPQGVNTHWKTQNCTIWNERKRAIEECELVYEVSWISELGTWRSFLRSQRRVGSAQ